MGTQQELFLWMLLALKGCMGAKAGVIMPRVHRDAIWIWYALYKNGTLLLLQAISVCDTVTNLNPEKYSTSKALISTSKALISPSKKWKYTSDQIYHTDFPP